MLQQPQGQCLRPPARLQNLQSQGHWEKKSEIVATTVRNNYPGLRSHLTNLNSKIKPSKEISHAPEKAREYL